MLKEVLRLGILFGIVGSVLYTFLLVGLSLINTSIRLGNNFERVLYDQICVGVVGVGFGLIFGSFLGLADGIILEFLFTRGKWNPYEIPKDRRWYCAISALVTGSLTYVILSAFTHAGQHIFLASVIAACGGWWVAHRVFTRKPPVSEQNSPTLNYSHETQYP